MRRLVVALILLIAVAGGVVLMAGPGAQASPDATITVNSTADTNTRDNDLTLREAIMLANGGLAVGDLLEEECAEVSNSTYGPPCSTTDSIGAGSADTIEFNIPGTGPHTIQPASALPDITDPVTIDGYTQPGASANTNPPDLGSNAVLKIELDGSNAGAGINGLKITAGSTTVRGLVINRFGFCGVLAVSNNVVLQGNFIGTDVTGTAAVGNGVGIYIDQTPNGTIGGMAPGARNVISGNGSGVLLNHAGGTLVQGNLIGTNAAGTAEVGNTSEGIRIYGSGSSGCTIGGTTAAARNVISGNTWGVEIGYFAAGNVIQGNFIGTNVAGTGALGNHIWGVTIHNGANSNTVGGTASGTGNIIAYTGPGTLGNGQGVQVSGASATGNTIRGNSIHSNVAQGIENVNGGNAELAPPTIESVGASVSGHTSPKCYPCTVEVFSDTEDEGRLFHGSTTTNDDASGTWTYADPVTGPNITATITDADGNTSEFSAPLAYYPPVGGIAALPDASGSSGPNHIPLAALAAAVLVALGASGWYARRRWLG